MVELGKIFNSLFPDFTQDGIQIKPLSRLLGHGQIQLTMNLYCHVTEDTLVEEMKKMEEGCI